MSAVRASRFTTSTPRAVFKSTMMLRLPRLTALKLGLSVPTAPSIVRVESSLGGSILTTSAPRSARIIDANGPAITCVTSTTRRPASAPRFASFIPNYSKGLMAETIFETTGPIAILTFNRPEARNAMTWGMYDALVSACEQVDANRDVRVFILKGAGGKAFVSGTDISQFQTFREPKDGIE